MMPSSISTDRRCGRTGVDLRLRLATAEDAKPNDAQIAHIAYTAGQIVTTSASMKSPILALPPANFWIVSANEAVPSQIRPSGDLILISKVRVSG